MKIVNLTPHPIRIGQAGMIPSSGVAHCSEIETQEGYVTLDGGRVPVFQIDYGRIDDLPAPADGVVYVVSQVVARAVPGRIDVFFPAGLQRDEEGKVVGAVALGRLIPPEYQS